MKTSTPPRGLRRLALGAGVVVLLLLGGPARALEIPFHKYSLANGLQVILHRDTSLPLVAVNIWYHTGPRNEVAGRSGFAHLFEHLMFQGSAHVADDQFFKLLSGAGASDVNGTTGYDRTNYYETMPKNQLALALWLEADRMGFLLPALTQKNLDGQRGVVMNERRQSIDNRPYGISQEALVQTLFPPSHPYFGNVIGSMTDLGKASLDDVKGFFRSYYVPGNATLVLAGDFEMAEAKALVKLYFDDIPAGVAPPPPQVTTPVIRSERRKVVQEPVSLARLSMGWLSAAYFTPGDAEADVLAYVLAGGKSSRMYKKLVYELELAQSVDVVQESNALSSIFTITATARPGVLVEKLEIALEAVLEDIRRKEVTDRELKRARNQLVTRTLLGLQSVGRKANRLNLYNQYLGDPGYLAQDLGRYDAVDGAALLKLARRLLQKEHRVVIVTQPQAAEPRPVSGATKEET